MEGEGREIDREREKKKDRERERERERDRERESERYRLGPNLDRPQVVIPLSIHGSLVYILSTQTFEYNSLE